MHTARLGQLRAGPLSPQCRIRSPGTRKCYPPRIRYKRPLPTSGVHPKKCRIFSVHISSQVSIPGTLSMIADSYAALVSTRQNCVLIFPMLHKTSSLDYQVKSIRRGAGKARSPGYAPRTPSGSRRAGSFPTQGDCSPLVLMIHLHASASVR